MPARLNRLRILMASAVLGTFLVCFTGLPRADEMSIYQRNCASCHDAGLAGAPKTGDVAAWKERIASGAENLTRNVIAGMQGYEGAMPPRGGNPKLTDAEIRSAVDFMIMRSR